MGLAETSVSMGARLLSTGGPGWQTGLPWRGDRVPQDRRRTFPSLRLGGVTAGLLVVDGQDDDPEESHGAGKGIIRESGQT